MTSIGLAAFAYCSGLTNVYCYAENVPSAIYKFYYNNIEYEYNTFYRTNIASATLHVPAGSLEAYSNTEPWSGFGNIVAIEDGPNIDFEDDNVKALCVAIWDTDKDGELSKAEAAAVTDLGEVFKGDTTITSFNELQYFIGLTEIPLQAFYRCTNLKAVTMPSTITSIGYSAFDDCYALAAIDIPSSVTFIDGAAFSDCRSLKSIILPDGIPSIGAYFFDRCTGLTSIKIPNSVTSIGYNAFYGCTGLTEIIIPESVTSISQFAFEGTAWYDNQPDGLVYAGKVAYKYKGTMPEGSQITIEDGTLGIANYAFYYCTNLTSITIPYSVTHIGNYVFYYCTSLTSVVSEIQEPFEFGTNAFNHISSTCVLTVPSGKQDAYIAAGWTHEIFMGGIVDGSETFTVTYEVKYDGNIVATATKKVSSGDNLPPVPASLYNDFITLKKYGNQPTKITKDVTVQYKAQWNGPFEFTKTLDNAKWYNMHIRSGYYVGKQDTEPYIPTKDVNEATLATLAYQWAFGGDPYHVKVYNRTTGLSETLTKDSVNAVMRPGDYTWDLLPNSDGFVLRVTGTVNTCVNHFEVKSLKFWTDSRSLTDNGSTFRVVEAVEPSPAIAFDDDKVKALCITQWDANGDGELSEAEATAVKSLDDVFKGNTTITSFDELWYFTSLTNIGDNAFKGCTKLASITLPENVTSIGKSAFYGCTSLRDINIPEGVNKINNYAFYLCSSLPSITIPESVTSIGTYAFGDCTGLTEIWCYAENTPAVVSNSFDGIDVSNVLLVVPENSLEQYQAHPVWGKFWVETPTPIASPFGETEEGAAIYNLAGQRLNKMQKGINIVGGKAILVK